MLIASRGDCFDPKGNRFLPILLSETVGIISCQPI
nr:MAG TPA: hypothetical protein [Caudoviricetes sp.]DAR99443.1 MAG TPA: hypothetical protein [Caudoviricetes sp.]DAY18172.1 MAG TPA: hypothetical protein [Caudoviricetes sp.]